MRVLCRGSGKPLLLIHGLGGSTRSWSTILDRLADARQVIALDLPGHGETTAEATSGTFNGLADAVDASLADQALLGIDAVGSSMGGRLVLE